jgi:hypothetical protein
LLNPLFGVRELITFVLARRALCDFLSAFLEWNFVRRSPSSGSIASPARAE